MFLKNSQNSQENICARLSVLIKFQVWDLQILFKKDSGTGAFLCIKWKF